MLDTYKQNILYTYSLGHLPQKDKVLFFYAIKGRGGKLGLIEKLKVEQLGRCVLLVPAEAEVEVDEFFKRWNCSFTKKQVLVGS